MPSMNIVAEIHSANQTLSEIQIKLSAIENLVSCNIFIPDSYPTVQKFIIKALIKGYIQNKEMLHYSKLTSHRFTYSQLEYQTKKLMNTFNVSSRSQLLRCLLSNFVKLNLD